MRGKTLIAHAGGWKVESADWIQEETEEERENLKASATELRVRWEASEDGIESRNGGAAPPARELGPSTASTRSLYADPGVGIPVEVLDGFVRRPAGAASSGRWDALSASALVGSVGCAVAAILTEQAVFAYAPVLLPLVALGAGIRSRSARRRALRAQVDDARSALEAWREGHDRAGFAALIDAIESSRRITVASLSRELAERNKEDVVEPLEARLTQLEAGLRVSIRIAKQLQRAGLGNDDAAAEKIDAALDALREEVARCKMAQDAVGAEAREAKEETLNVVRTRLVGIESSIRAVTAEQEQANAAAMNSQRAMLAELEKSVASEVARSVAPMQQLPQLLSAAAQGGAAAATLSSNLQPPQSSLPPAQSAPVDLSSESLEEMRRALGQELSDAMQAGDGMNLNAEQWSALGKRLKHLEDGIAAMDSLLPKFVKERDEDLLGALRQQLREDDAEKTQALLAQVEDIVARNLASRLPETPTTNSTMTTTISPRDEEDGKQDAVASAAAATIDELKMALEEKAPQIEDREEEEEEEEEENTSNVRLDNDGTGSSEEEEKVARVGFEDTSATTSQSAAPDPVPSSSGAAGAMDGDILLEKEGGESSSSSTSSYSFPPITESSLPQDEDEDVSLAASSKEEQVDEEEAVDSPLPLRYETELDDETVGGIDERVSATSPSSSSAPPPSPASAETAADGNRNEPRRQSTSRRTPRSSSPEAQAQGGWDRRPRTVRADAAYLTMREAVNMNKRARRVLATRPDIEDLAYLENLLKISTAALVRLRDEEGAGGAAEGNLGNAYLIRGEAKLRIAQSIVVYGVGVEGSEEQALVECDRILVSAGRCFRAVLRSNPSDTRALQAWGKALSVRAEAAMAPTGDRETAVRLYEAAEEKYRAQLEIDPSRVSAILSAADIAFRVAKIMRVNDDVRRASLGRARIGYIEALRLDGSNTDASRGLDMCEQMAARRL